jgi:hypothetical protein
MSFFFRPDQLQQRAHQWHDGQKELVLIREEITDRTGRSINPAKLTVVKYWADQGFHSIVRTFHLRNQLFRLSRRRLCDLLVV